MSLFFKTTAMKAIINIELNNQEITYPCLMESECEVVLFTSMTIGTVVGHKMKSPWPIGHHLVDLYPKAFTPFKGTVTLSND
jgi:hypothetical protein